MESVLGFIPHLPTCSRVLRRGDEKQSLSYSLPQRSEKNKSQLIEILGPFLIRGICTLLEPRGFLRTGPGSFSQGVRVKSIASAVRPSSFVSALRSWVVLGKWCLSSVPPCPCLPPADESMSCVVDSKRESPRHAVCFAHFKCSLNTSIIKAAFRF